MFELSKNVERSINYVIVICECASMMSQRRREVCFWQLARINWIISSFTFELKAAAAADGMLKLKNLILSRPPFLARCQNIGKTLFKKDYDFEFKFYLTLLTYYWFYCIKTTLPPTKKKHAKLTIAKQLNIHVLRVIHHDYNVINFRLNIDN